MSKFGTPVRIVAPTIQRFSFTHAVSGGRVMACVVDVSVDEFATSRVTAMNDVAGSMPGVWQDSVAPAISPGVTFTGGHWIDLDSLDGTSGSFGAAGGHPGVGTATMVDTEPPNVCWLIKKSCNANRSQKNGRMYLPGAGTDWINNDGTVIAAKKTIIDGRMAALRTNILNLSTTLSISTVAWRVVHVHKPDRTNPNTWTWSSSDVTSATCDNRVATQRRRLRG